MEKPKIFWRLRRLEAGLSGFKIKRVHYGKFGLQIIIYHPCYTKPNKAFSSLITPKPDLHPPSLSNPSPFSSLRLLLRSSLRTGDGGSQGRRRRPPSFLTSPLSLTQNLFPFLSLASSFLSRPASCFAQPLASPSHYQRRRSHFRRWRARIWRETPDTSSGESLLFVLTSFSFTLWYILWEAEFGLRIWDQQST